MSPLFQHRAVRTRSEWWPWTKTSISSVTAVRWETQPLASYRNSNPESINKCVSFYSAGLRSASVHRGRWKRLLPTGWQDPVYEVPHQTSQAGCAVIGCCGDTQIKHEPKAQDLLSCIFAFATGLYSVNLCLCVCVRESVHCGVSPSACSVVSLLCLSSLIGAEVMYCTELNSVSVIIPDVQSPSCSIVFVPNQSLRLNYSITCTRAIW